MRYVFDLDKTICDTKQKEDGTWGYLEALPFPDRVERVNSLYDEGHYIIVETARGNTSKKNWYEKTYTQLINFGLKFHELRTGVKFMADVYVDDKAINSEDFFNPDPKDDNNGSYLKQESGGKTNVILVNRVFKEATDERMTKLVDEINFIEAIPEEFKKYFPRIVSSGTAGNKAFYEMEHHNLPTLRRLILSDQISKEEVLYWTEKITSISMDLYNFQIIEMPVGYFDVMHFRRLNNRLAELSEKSEWFKRELHKKTVIINGIDYLNISEIACKFNNKSFINSVQPEFVGRWSHSDLHFSNVLIDRENDSIVMIDPRGYDYCDYFYDYGKLWHSVNGKYELISSRRFNFIKDGEYSLLDGNPYRLLESLKDGIFDILCKFSNESTDNVMRKTRWNEVMHFCSLIPFLLDFDGKDERSKVAYYTSVKLINEFANDYMG